MKQAPKCGKVVTLLYAPVLNLALIHDCYNECIFVSHVGTLKNIMLVSGHKVPNN
jgi:hypothetical protein